jgi:hypothetical protein
VQHAAPAKLVQGSLKSSDLGADRKPVSQCSTALPPALTPQSSPGARSAKAPWKTSNMSDRVRQSDASAGKADPLLSQLSEHVILDDQDFNSLVLATSCRRDSSDTLRPLGLCGSLYQLGSSVVGDHLNQPAGHLVQRLENHQVGASGPIGSSRRSGESVPSAATAAEYVGFSIINPSPGPTKILRIRSIELAAGGDDYLVLARLDAALREPAHR